MTAIFFDLETSDKNFIGQILNYSFIVVDSSYNLIDELSGRVKISRLQLPSPSAIFANKVDVLKHQQESHIYEPEAMLSIARFIAKHCNPKTHLIGFNSSRFDIGYLRTSLIRSGINPYFKGKIIYRDLLHAARKLSVSRADFPRKEGELNSARLSLSLETLGRNFGLLNGAQAHESRADVMLTIELAKLFKEEFDLDVFNFEPYQGSKFHSSLGKSTVYESYQPQYDLSIDKLSRKVPVVLLDADHRYALWIDIERYLNGEKEVSIQWTGQAQGYFFCDGIEIKERSILEGAQAALSEFSSINLKNFFSKSQCDIEQDIYRLDISMIELLSDAIWKGQVEPIKRSNNRDLRSIFTRYQLANYNTEGHNDAQFTQKLKDYALYRYGGKLRLDKGSLHRAKEDIQQGRASIHPTLSEMMIELEKLKEFADTSDIELLESLATYYDESEIVKVVGSLS